MKLKAYTKFLHLISGRGKDEALLGVLNDGAKRWLDETIGQLKPGGVAQVSYKKGKKSENYWVVIARKDISLPQYMEAKAKRLIQEYPDDPDVLMELELARKWGLK